MAVLAAAGHGAGAQPAEGPDGAAGGAHLEAPGAPGLPEAHAALPAAAGEAAAGQRAEGKDAVRVPLQHGPAAEAGRGLPQPHGRVLAAAGDHALGGHAEGIDPVPVPRKRGDAAGRAEVPHSHAAINAAAGERLLGQAAGCPDIVRMALQRGQAAGRGHVPDAHGFVLAAARQGRPAQPAQCVDFVCMPCEGCGAAARREVPQLHCVVLAGAGQRLRVQCGERSYSVRVSLERGLALPLLAPAACGSHGERAAILHAKRGAVCLGGIIQESSLRGFRELQAPSFHVHLRMPKASPQAPSSPPAQGSWSWRLGTPSHRDPT